MGEGRCWKDGSQLKDASWARMNEQEDLLQKQWVPKVSPPPPSTAGGNKRFLPQILSETSTTGAEDVVFMAWTQSTKLNTDAFKKLAEAAAWYFADKNCGYGRETENARDVMDNLRTLGIKLD